jgi:integrase
VNVFKIVMVKHSNGERLPVLIDSQTRQPIYFANEYILYVRRTRVSSATLVMDLQTLSYFLGWGLQAKIDIQERLKSGEGLTVDELSMGIVPWLRRSFSSKKVVSLVVSNHSAQRRVDFIREFISWNMHCVISRLSSSDPRIKGVQAKLQSMEVAFRHLKLKTKVDKKKVEGLSRSSQNRLLEVCHPDYSENPWHKNVRTRNYLILLLFLSFGIRRGELLKLYVSDCLTQGTAPELRIQRRPDDFFDPRRIEPNVKTESRILPLNSMLAQLIDSYISIERRKVHRARKHPFLFISRKGDPIALQTINALLAQIGLKHPEFEGLHPHILRHTANTRLREKARERGQAHSDFEKNLKYINGWKTNNTGTYTQLDIKNEALNLIREHQKSMFQNIGET